MLQQFNNFKDYKNSFFHAFEGNEFEASVVIVPSGKEVGAWESHI